MDSSDKPEDRPGLRRRLMPLVALLAMAGFLVALSSLKASEPAPAGVDLAAQAGQQAAPAAALPAVGDVLPAAAAPAAAEPAAAPAANSTTASTTSVEIMGYKFSPATLTISVGDTVVWTNHDTAPHNVVISDGPVKFTSPTLNTGDTYQYTFTVAGTYDYYCSIHPDMKASVTVEGSGSTPPTTPPPAAGSCVSSAALSAFMAHVQAAHLERSPFQQVNDALAVDQYVLTHTVWLEQVLRPVFDGTADQVVKDTLAPVIAHIEAAHLERSPLQQVTDILAVDQYVLTHTVWLETVLKPAAEQLTC